MFKVSFFREKELVPLSVNPLENAIRKAPLEKAIRKFTKRICGTGKLVR